MKYWLDLFSGTTWEQFRSSGALTTGFNLSRKNLVARIQPGDVLLCYMTGVMRWVGALRVVGPSDDDSPIFGDGKYPLRLAVTPIVILNPEHGVPMSELSGKVSFYEGIADDGKFKGFVRGSPAEFRSDNDGNLILKLLQESEEAPTVRPVDPKKLAYRPFFKAPETVGTQSVERDVTVPESEDETSPDTGENFPSANATRHTEIQSKLATLGAEMGFDIWVPRSDRSKVWNGTSLGRVTRLIDPLPVQLNSAAQRIVELLDVLWLKDNAIVAAFEVEATTSIYSGLLRMNDLLLSQPNLQISLYLVAPDERRNKVGVEILRPTFSLRQGHQEPLARACGFLSFSKLTDLVSIFHQYGLVESVTPNFLVGQAEYFNKDSDL